jgi:D-alanine-D-alanine ligase-like ATP-grasp enzyme
VGVDGETGIVEELCERCKVKLVGHTHFHSHLVGDKQNFSYALEQHNIKVPFGKVILKKEYSKDKLKDVFSTVPFPAVVKPLRGSNGWGVNIVTNFAEFERAVEFLISDDKDVLVQKLILGVPISCFVFEHGNLLHTNIKADDTAELTREDLITVRNDALYIHSVMAFSHHASYDFVMQIKNGKKQLYFLEANTHPSLMTDFIKESFGKSVKIQDYVRSKIT